jgi:phosphoenolpyruvate carboxylase
LHDLLQRLQITAVLTAHPTEARRRTVLETLHRGGTQLERLDDSRLSPGERAEAERALAEEVTALWRTDQLRQAKPEPLDEVRAAMWLFDETIFRLVPDFYRELDRTLDPDAAGRRPPPFRPFLRWGSWIGGDRDGNPTVTAAVTRRVLPVHADHVLRGLEAATRRVARELSASELETPPSMQLISSLERDARTIPRSVADLQRKFPDAPHRRKLTIAAERLAATRARGAGAYPGPQDFLADLHLVQRSLSDAGADRLAYGELQGLVWQAETFGFHLASLEIRQHADVHRRALHELMPGIDGDPRALDRLAARGVTHPPGARELSTQTREALATFRVMSELQGRFGAEACRRYVVSFTRTASDILAVRALARIAVPDGSLELDVVPLVESRADLEGAPALLDELVAFPGFLGWLEARERRMEVQLGYSDSAKDAGVLAANVVLYRAQASLAAWARRNDIELTLFHGRGGALGRGGGPAGRAIAGQAPGSVDGRFKVTEQGEVLAERYGNEFIARRHLEQVTSAVLEVSTPAAESGADVERRFDGLATAMADESERVYRSLVERPGFVAFFTRATPSEEIGRLAIGSRPAKRGGRAGAGLRAGADEGLDDLRAIPWVFAWAQSRVNLPGWFGLGSGLQAVADAGGVGELREMYRAWPFFRSLLENAQLSLAKADLPIAELWFELGRDEELARLISEEYERTVRLVLTVTEQQALLESRVVLRRAIELRNPYVDALSFLQLRFLRELREAEARGAVDDAARLRRLVHTTINGIAAGLQNTG